MLVLVTDHVPAGGTGAVDLDGIKTAAPGGRLFAAWAEVGADPVPHGFAAPPRTSAAAQRLMANPTSRPSCTTADINAEMDDVEVQVRASFHDHPAVGLAGIAVAGTDGQIHGQRMPVLLLEPRRAVMMTHADHNVVREARVEAVVAEGFDRALPTPASILNEARDWQPRRTGGLIELRNPAGQITARGNLHRYPPGWLDAAHRLGAVLVIYGPQVGVRAPKGRPYNDRDRRDELDASRRAGHAAWALVDWCPPN